ncbi:hypothetical protein GEMRC1_004681 [Eukaryota sp. GEM-RC1]
MCSPSPIDELQKAFPVLPLTHIQRVFNDGPDKAESLLTRHAVDLTHLSETFPQIPAVDLWAKFAVCKFDLNRASVYISDQLSPRNVDHTRTQQQQGFGSSRKPASHGSAREFESIERRDLERLFKEFPSINRSDVTEAFNANSKRYTNTKAAINRMLVLDKHSSKTSGNSTSHSKVAVAKRTRSQSSHLQGQVDDHYPKETMIVEEDFRKETPLIEEDPNVPTSTTLNKTNEGKQPVTSRTVSDLTKKVEINHFNQLKALKSSSNLIDFDVHISNNSFSIHRCVLNLFRISS